MAGEEEAQGEFEDIDIGGVKGMMGDLVNETNQQLPAEGEQAQEQQKQLTPEEEEEQQRQQHQQATPPEEEQPPEEEGEPIPELPEDMLSVLGVEEEEGEPQTPEEIEAEFPEPEGLQDKQAEAFKAMRQQIVELRKKSETEATGDEALKQELEQTKARLSMHDLTQDPTFKKTYDQPIAKQVALAQNYLKQFEADPKEVARLARLPIKERLATLSEEFPAAAGILAGVFSEIDALGMERTKALREHAQTKANLQTERQRQQVDGFNDALDVSVEQLRREQHLLLMESKKAPKWNEKVQTRIQMARELATKVDDPDELARITLKAAMADEYLAMYRDLSQKFEQSVTKGANLRRARPKIGDGASPTPRTGADKPNYEKPRQGEQIADAIAARGF